MRVNGKEQTLDVPMNLQDFLSQAGFNVQRVVVERNGAIITREHFADTMLHNDDRLEVVQFVGGG
ncbi:MAG: sulfur carrier protein ThiS [Peptococcaceae bacterium]|nr:sulfur carrier protein ThiS [Peptococcaceae bacterium]